MKVMEMFSKKENNLRGEPTVTLAFLGDSVTQGCFEVYTNERNGFEAIYDISSAYHTYLKQMLAMLYPAAPVQIINAGVSGDDAPGGLKRLHRDVIRYQPDLAVVCFGLNDVGKGPDKVQIYVDAMEGIFKELKEAGIETIFMTPSMMCTKVSPHLKEEVLREAAQGVSRRQNAGELEYYIDHAKALCEKYGVTVCDCYADWKRLEQHGVNTTDLLANYINHPRRDMNWLFALRLLETMMK